MEYTGQYGCDDIQRSIEISEFVLIKTSQLLICDMDCLQSLEMPKSQMDH